MNPRKRPGGSGASSVGDVLSRAASVSSVEEIMTQRPTSPLIRLNRSSILPPDATVQLVRRPAMSTAMSTVMSAFPRSVGSSDGQDAGEDGDDEEEDEEEEDEDGEEADEVGSEGAPAVNRSRRMSPEQISSMKREILYQLERIEAKGVRLPRRFTMADPLDEMKAELDRLKLDREIDLSVRFQRKMLMACVTGIEMLNGRFDPFSVRLQGWSDSMHESIDDYDDVFEELYLKYRGSAKMAPELKLMMMVGGSGLMFHLSATMFRQSSVPGLEQVLRQNPALRQQFAQAAMAHMNGTTPQPPPSQPPPQSSPNIFGVMSGLFGGFGGGGGGGGSSPPAPATSARGLRGPRNVEDILKDMHSNAFAGGSGGGVGGGVGGDVGGGMGGGNMVEIVVGWTHDVHGKPQNRGGHDEEAGQSSGQVRKRPHSPAHSPTYVRSLRSILNQLTDGVRALENAAADASNDDEYLMEELDAKKRKLDATKRKLDATNRKLDEVLEERDSLTSDLKRVTSDLNRVTADLDRVTADLDRVTADRDRVTADLDEVSTELDRVTADLDTAHVELQSTSQDLERTKTDLEDMETSHNRLRDRLDSFGSSYGDIKNMGFKRVQLMLHPDKVRDPALKVKADIAFKAVTDIFEKLADWFEDPVVEYEVPEDEEDSE
ncbi:hypothetical protein CEUSTIGMA_g12201.t1 [Chlamydomonas eustigma]|uniref:t-SNARE coiled-coil homology domain-containing protein n=1 Tax=Chlamydomonas eustigma TaxID=1157962 RepID=A0A250XPQ8_9CHLO|nr:hypothetical protein CEUSTIGMA_g12201.t1 [Chlamydomonas eustigma]|eukprot:GAX84780.1 hypothetical protein CEUSTIGMA_g12201.t1 [Chlamydomonas eustigma]